ncbi:MAG: hypothetical protein ACI8Q1_002471 [Parvicella sp.]|jgi:hypothetical protein
MNVYEGIKFKKVTSLGYGQPVSFALTETGDVYVTGVVSEKPQYKWVKIASDVRTIFSGRAIKTSGQLLDFDKTGYVETVVKNALSFSGTTKIVGTDGRLYTMYLSWPKDNPEDNLLPILLGDGA